MSNLWINISFGIWYLQIGPDRPFIEFKKHSYPDRIKDKPWFVVHALFGYHP